MIKRLCCCNREGIAFRYKEEIAEACFCWSWAVYLDNYTILDVLIVTVIAGSRRNPPETRPVACQHEPRDPVVRSFLGIEESQESSVRATIIGEGQAVGNEAVRDEAVMS